MLTQRQKEVWKLIQDGYSNDEIAAKLNISYSTVRNHKKVINKKVKNSEELEEKNNNEKFSSEFEENKGKINSISNRLRTVDDVIKFAEIDLDVWEIEKVKTSFYEMGRKDKKVDMEWVEGSASGTVKDSGGWNTNGLWSINLTLKKKVKDPVEEALKSIEKRLETKAPKFMKLQPAIPNNPHMLEISVCDAHFGKLAVNGEGLNRTEKLYTLAIDNILEKTKGFQIGKILLPLGSDFFHVDNIENTTSNSTRQDVSHHIFDIYDRGCMAIVNMIYKLRTIAPVEILWIPGNHDFSTSRHLCTWLQAWFRNDGEVEVRVGKNPRKYVKYGSTLIGLTHGNEEKISDLPLIMVNENRKNISDVEYFEIHIGHLHKKKQTNYLASDTVGFVPVKILPSLSSTDAWHLKKGYHGIRAIESYLYSFKHGPIGNFQCNLKEIEF